MLKIKIFLLRLILTRNVIKYILKTSGALFFAALLFLPVMAESPAGASITGYCVDEENGETLVGASVYLLGTKLGARTNKSGFYSITGVPAGEYTVVVSYVGYDKLETKISLGANDHVRRKFSLKLAGVETEEISVVADRQKEKRQITISKVNIPIKKLEEIRVGGETDVFRSLQYLPGVLTSSQISSGLFVRGGSPDQNLVLLDGSTVYNPTHLFGFISTFNTDAVKDVELIKGGFQAEYGGRLSAALNITQKDGDKKRYRGKASVGVISSRASAQGPLGDGSFFISGRRTYFELVKAFIPKDPDEPLPGFHFYDVNAKIMQNLSENDKLFLSGFMSEDDLDYDSFGMTVGLEISNKLAAAKWTHIFNESLFSTVNLSYSKYLNGFDGSQSGYDYLMANSIEDYTLKAGVEWFVSDAATAKIGYEGSKFDFNFLMNFTGDTDNKESSPGNTQISASDWNHAVYAQANCEASDLFSFQAGLRTNYWAQRDRVLLDPRIAARYYLFESVAVKAAYGIYHQNLRLATMPDFSFFDTWLPTDSTIEPSRAAHYIVSFETQPEEGYDLNFDFYYKKMENVSEINRSTIQTSGLTTVSDVFYVGDAESWGAEIFLQKRFDKLTGWLGYALGYIRAQFDSINGGNSFRPKYDRLHDFKVVAQYELNKRWSFGASFTFQSGQSYTGVTSRFQSRLPNQNYGKGKVYNSQRYGLRLPPSHQLNVNASYSFETFGFDSKLILDVFNVYNRRDIWFRYYNTVEDVVEVEDVLLLPILPTLSYEINFE